MRLVTASAFAWAIMISPATSGAQQQPASPGRPSRPATSPSETPRPPATPPPEQPAVGSAPLLSNPYPSTYKPLPSRTTVIRNATILTAAGPVIERGSILLQAGRIAAVGQNVNAPADALVIDASGKWITPGIIDTHSHLGVYPAPGIASVEDGNEVTSPNTAEVWAEHSIWPQDPQFDLALMGA